MLLSMVALARDHHDVQVALVWMIYALFHGCLAGLKLVTTCPDGME